MKHMKSMKDIFFGLLLLLVVLAGCQNLEPVRYVDPADPLTGYFQIQQRRRNRKEPATIIPVLKIDGTYYSVCRGFEVPFERTSVGLEWDIEPSSMTGTTIGCRPGGNYFIIIRDSLSEDFTGETSRPHNTGPRSMTRISEPASLLDPTASRPRSNDDFVGCYMPRWFPYYKITIRKEGETFLAEAVILISKEWAPDQKVVELMPFSDRIGFSNFDKRHSIEYNERLNRFEMVKATTPPLRMPLVRVNPAAPPPEPILIIGVPSWH